VVIECRACYVDRFSHHYGKQSLRRKEYGTIHAVGIIEGKVYT